MTQERRQGLLAAAHSTALGMQPQNLEEADMADRTRGLGFLLAALLLAVGCAPVTRDLVSGAPPAVPAAGPIAGHPPITASGVVKSFDPATGILRFEDGRLVKLTAD